MYCTNCGNRIPEDSNFCPSCGAPVSTDHYAPDRGRIDQNVPSVSRNNDPSHPSSKPGKKKSRWPILVIVLLLVIVIAAVAAFLLLRGNGGDGTGASSETAEREGGSQTAEIQDDDNSRSDSLPTLIRRDTVFTQYLYQEYTDCSELEGFQEEVLSELPDQMTEQCRSTRTVPIGEVDWTLGYYYYRCTEPGYEPTEDDIYNKVYATVFVLEGAYSEETIVASMEEIYGAGEWTFQTEDLADYPAFSGYTAEVSCYVWDLAENGDYCVELVCFETGAAMYFTRSQGNETDDPFALLTTLSRASTAAEANCFVDEIQQYLENSDPDAFVEAQVVDYVRLPKHITPSIVSVQTVFGMGICPDYGSFYIAQIVFSGVLEGVPYNQADGYAVFGIYEGEWKIAGLLDDEWNLLY